MSHARKFAILGALGGLGAPSGVLVYGLVRGGLPDALAIFGLMVAGGTLCLGIAGWMIGRREDELLAVNQELRTLSRSLARQTLTDALTAVPNRRSFDVHLTTEISRARRYHMPLALVMIDIDHFKDLNDRFGHPIGDEVLRQIAARLDVEKRQGDIVARYGGEEFAAILPHTRAEEALAWAERARHALEMSPIELGGHRFPVSASFGVAELIPSDEGAEDLLAAADQALYAAKGRGRNRVEMAQRPRETPLQGVQ